MASEPTRTLVWRLRARGGVELEHERGRERGRRRPQKSPFRALRTGSGAVVKGGVVGSDHVIAVAVNLLPLMVPRSANLKPASVASRTSWREEEQTCEWVVMS